MLLPSLGTWLYFDLFAGRGSWSNLLYALTKGTQLILPVAWQVLERRHKLSWPTWQTRSATLGLLFGLVSIAAILFSYQWLTSNTQILRDTPLRLQAKLTDFRISGLVEYFAMAVFICIFHAAFEEYYWRWFIFRQLSEGWNWSWAAIISSLAFALHHVIVIRAYLPGEHWWTFSLILALGVAVGGSIWAWIYTTPITLLGRGWHTWWPIWQSCMSGSICCEVIGYE